MDALSGQPERRLGAGFIFGTSVTLPCSLAFHK